jgi:hypothetical protein
MTGEGPFRGAFPHQHGDPRTLAERIHQQLRERIQEAAEMAGLELMVERRRRRGLPPLETSSDPDRREFEQTARDLLAYLRSALVADLAPDDRAALESAEAGQDPPAHLLSAHVYLAGRLPDYWQRFESGRAEFARSRLDAPLPSTGWLGRFFGR